MNNIEEIKNEQTLQSNEIVDDSIKQEKVNSEKTTEEEKKKISMSLNTFLLILILNILINFGSIFVYDKYFAQKIVKFDLLDFINEQRNLYVSGKIDNEQVKANLMSVEKKIKNLPKNKIILLSEVVMGNAETIKP